MSNLFRALLNCSGPKNDLEVSSDLAVTIGIASVTAQSLPQTFKRFIEGCFIA